MPNSLHSFFCCILWILLFSPTLGAFAQNESDQAPLLAVEQGLSVRKDSIFLTNFRFRMQNRIGFWDKTDQAPAPGFEARVRRLRLRLDGFVGTPKLSYYLQLSFSRADQDLIDDSIPQIVRDAMIYYFFRPDFYIGFGQSKLPGNRQRVISSGNLQMPERSLANQAFNIDRDFGVFVYKYFSWGKQYCQLKTALTSGEGRNTILSDHGLAYTARIDWLPLGKFINLGDYSEGDLEFEPTAKLALGIAYSFNHRAVKRGGQIGRPLAMPVDMQTAIIDLMFKYKGWAVLAEYLYRKITPSFPPPHNLTTFYRIPQGAAWNVQASRMIGKKNEIVLRYSELQPFSQVAEFQVSLRTKAIGMNHYWNKHRIKAQAYLGLDDRIHHSGTQGLPYSFNNRLQVLFQMEFGI